MVIDGLYYTKEHEWLKIDGKTVVIGIADHAQDALGEITFVELPEKAQQIQAGGAFAVVESSKAASDVYSPIAGTVTEVNAKLENEPELINNDCYGQGWLAKIEIAAEPKLDELMDSARYEEYLKTIE